jgi:hypothetical protein
MRIVAPVMTPDAVRRILRHEDIPADPPPMAPACASPQDRPPSNAPTRPRGTAPGRADPNVALASGTGPDLAGSRAGMAVAIVTGAMTNVMPDRVQDSGDMKAIPCGQ